MAIEIISTLKPKNNGTFPIAEAKDIDVNGVRLDEKLENMGTGGGGSGGGILDVTELPTEGIDEQSIYRLKGEGSAEVYLCMDLDGDGANDVMTFAEFFAMQGENGIIITHVVETLPETLIQSVGITLHFYVVKSTGIVYLDVGNGAVTAGENFGDASMNKGWSTDIASETEQGIYSVSLSTYTYHACKDGKWVELVDKTYADNKATEEASKVRGLKTLGFSTIEGLYNCIASIAGSAEFFRVKCDGEYSYTYKNENGETAHSGGLMPALTVEHTVVGENIVISMIYNGIDNSIQIGFIGNKDGLISTTMQRSVNGVIQEVTSTDFSGLTNFTLYYF
jgi:hypothetical protein